MDLVRRNHIVRARDLERARIPRNYLTRLVESGQLQKLERDQAGFVDDDRQADHLVLGLSCRPASSMVARPTVTGESTFRPVMEKIERANAHFAG